LAAHNLHLDVGQCVVVEDSQSGIQAAHAAGIGHIIALSPVEQHPRIEQLEGVDRVIEDLSQIPKETVSSAEAAGTLHCY